MTCEVSSLSWFQRIAQLVVGHTVNKVLLDWPFDYILYPWVLFNLGVLNGGLVMMLLSLLVCLVAIRFYDWSKRDWLGLELIKDLKGYEGSNVFNRIASWFLRRGDIPAFLYMTIKHDPFITMVYLRKGAFNGMSRRDWRIFIASLILGNSYWILACWMGISLVEWAWKMVSS